MSIDKKETTPIETIKAAIGAIAADRARLLDQIEALSRVLDALQIAQIAFSGTPTSGQPSLQIAPQTNRAIITQILRDAGEPLQISEIARLANEKGLIKSTRGYHGIYGTVATVLARNSKHVFMQIRRGTWDLRDRSRQFAVMVDIGAGKSHAVRQLLTADETDDFSHRNPFTKSSTVQR
jgi:hypothetical protein